MCTSRPNLHSQNRAIPHPDCSLTLRHADCYYTPLAHPASHTPHPTSHTLQCVPKLASVLQICAFIFFVFGILGVQLFAGALRSRCYDVDTGSGGESFCGGMEECRSRCVNQILNPQLSNPNDPRSGIRDGVLGITGDHAVGNRHSALRIRAQGLGLGI